MKEIDRRKRTDRERETETERNGREITERERGRQGREIIKEREKATSALSAGLKFVGA